MSFAREDTLPALTGLRFIAAMSIAVGHAAATTLRIEAASPFITAKYWLSASAGLGMPLFFVLSGFVIHYNYSGIFRGDTKAALGSFLWARFSRLYPLYILIIVAEVVFSSAFFNYLNGKPNQVYAILAALPYYLTMTQSWVYTLHDNIPLIYAFGVVTPLTWSISTEWFFYLCYPALLAGIVRLKTIQQAAIGVGVFTLVFGLAMLRVTFWIDDLDAWAGRWFGQAATSASNGQNCFVRWFYYFAPYVRIGEFILGCLTAQLYNVMRHRPIGPVEATTARFIVPASIILTLYLMYIMFVPGADNLIGRMKGNFALAPVLAALIFCVARYRSTFADLFSARPLVTLGAASYSIYLLHIFVYSAAIGWAPEMFRDGPWVFPYLLFRMTAMLALVLLLSLGIYSFLEVPAKRWLRSIRWRRHEEHVTSALRRRMG